MALNTTVDEAVAKQQRLDCGGRLEELGLGSLERGLSFCKIVCASLRQVQLCEWRSPLSSKTLQDKWSCKSRPLHLFVERAAVCHQEPLETPRSQKAPISKQRGVMNRGGSIPW